VLVVELWALLRWAPRWVCLRVMLLWALCALGVALDVLACGFALGWAGRPLKICFVCPLLFAQGGGVECAFARC
jgi:hypothetical protein